MATKNEIIQTAEQKAICHSSHRILIVEANAGSGKTTTAAMKIARMIENGADPSKIIALTYTKPAIQAYYDAFRRLRIKTAVAGEIRIETFEDFSAKRLCEFQSISAPRLDSPEQVRGHVLQAIAQARNKAIAKGYGSNFSIREKSELAVEGLLNEFAYIKGTLLRERERDQYSLTPKYAEEIGQNFSTLAVLAAYEKQRLVYIDPKNNEERVQYRYAGDATYDLACLFEAPDPIYTQENNPLRLGLEAIVVDEMHDMNWAMFVILKELLQQNEAAHFFGIGDRDQVLHAVAGAESGFMRETFQQYIAKPQSLELSKTFRFGNTLAKPLSQFSGKQYFSVDGANTHIEVREVQSPNDLFGLINTAVTERQGLSPGSPNSEIAVLLKNPATAVELEHLLRWRGVKYSTRGFTTYLERPEILFIRLLLSAAVKLPEQFSAKNFEMAATATWQFTGVTSVIESGSAGVHRRNLKQSNPYGVVVNVLEALFKIPGSADLRDRISTMLDIAVSDEVGKVRQAIGVLGLQELAAQSFVQVQAIESVMTSVDGLIRAAESYRSISDFLRALLAYDRDANAQQLNEDRIVLASIEAVKGLEYEHVIVPDVNHKTFDASVADARNLFYVAATRTRNRLTLAHRTGRSSAYLSHFRKD